MRGRTLQIICYCTEAKTFPFLSFHEKISLPASCPLFSVSSMDIGIDKPTRNTTVSLYFYVMVLNME